MYHVPRSPAPQHLTILDGPQSYQAWLDDLQVACYPSWLWPLLLGTEPLLDMEEKKRPTVPEFELRRFTVNKYFYTAQQDRLRQARELLINSVGPKYRSLVLRHENPAKAVEALKLAVRGSVHDASRRSSMTLVDKKK